MNRGPQPKKNEGDRERFTLKLDKRFAPNTPPEWLVELAEYADIFGLRVTGEKIGYVGGVVSSTISGKYKGDLASVEKATKAAFMDEVVDCPILGEIARAACTREQKNTFPHHFGDAGAAV